MYFNLTDVKWGRNQKSVPLERSRSKVSLKVRLLSVESGLQFIQETIELARIDQSLENE